MSDHPSRMSDHPSRHRLRDTFARLAAEGRKATRHPSSPTRGLAAEPEFPEPRTGYQPPRYAWTGNTQSARERFVELVTWPHAMRSAELAELAHLAADPATADDGAEWSAALLEVSAEDRRTLARIETSQATARAIFAAMVTP